MDPSETHPDNDPTTINGPDLSSPSCSDDDDSDLCELRTENGALIAELKALRFSFQSLQSRTAAAEENLDVVEKEKEDVLKLNLDLNKRTEEVSSERDLIRDEINRVRVCLEERENAFDKQMDKVKNKVEVSRKRIEELESERREIVRVLSENLGSIQTVKEGLMRMIDIMDEEEVGNFSVVEKEEGTMGAEFGLDEELRVFSEDVMGVSKLASIAETKLSEYQKMRKKEKRELENSVVSLTEENRDLNSLFRIALVEKEELEKSLNKLKRNNDQKRVAILQMAERGLHKVGFGFMMGGASIEQALDSSEAIIASSKSDSSECEEEVISLASTVEKIMKNLRLEITQLRSSLDESRLDTERLQSLTETQTHTIAENTLYIKELEDRERVMAQSVEELWMDIKETEEELARWREACELEVEAGKTIVEERDKRVAILQQELEKTKAALEISNSKLKLKEDLAAAAMTAQAAAERSLQLADSRAAGLRERIEELTRQLEEPENREWSLRRVRRICWPWRVL